ncbi:unnamed protein product [Blepharisma stoltei]|uniref:C-CAP/cofactor C-like domain-containing protein n=1 Tax=Blepharisma stoltei TaxID=1481888 RepID=A0AAU9IIM8_9CILI|nr:unnamed protein product [Blepharisma stoltei]
MSRDKIGLQIRTELFDHGVFPCPQRLNQSSIVNLVKSLYLSASHDGKITISQWAEAAIKQLSLTLQEAEIYFELFRSLAYERKPQQPIIDIKPFAIFLILQLYSTATTRISLENASSLTSKFNSDGPGFSASGTYPSPASSPRAKAVRGFLFSQPASDFQMSHQFVKSNLKLLMKVISADLQAAEVALTSTEFNSLGFLCIPTTGTPEVPISRMVPFYQTKPQTARVHSDDLSEWINRKLVCVTNESVAERPGVLLLTGLNRSVVIKGQNECQGKDIRLSNCEESYVYINTAVKQISMINCREVTLYVAAVSKVATMDKCELCTIALASNMLRVGNSVDCTVYTYSPFPPVLYGDNRGITLGPFNVYYPEVIRMLEAAEIPNSSINPKCIHNWSAPIEMNSEQSGHCFTLLQPKDFFKLVLPSQFGAQNPVLQLTPEEFVSAIRIREEYFASIQGAIAKAGLNEEQERRLHLSIQGYFREWLVSSGHVKGPLELVRMIDQE